MFRKPPGEDASAIHADPEPVSRAAAVREKLNCALGALAELDEQVAEFALEAAERQPGAADRLAGQRSKIEAAKTAVDELRAALRLAERLDRRALAAGAAQMRAQQLAVFRENVTAREKAMGRVLDAAKVMAKAYGEYSEATLRMLAATPSGTVIPVMSMGPEGTYGPAFGPGERMVLAEIYRSSPDRSDGIGKFVLPFAKPSSERLRNKPEDMPAGIDELRAAHAAIVDSIASQIARLDESAMQAAETTTDRKDAA